MLLNVVFMMLCVSGSGHIAIGILVDLHDFWSYENRELLLAELKDSSDPTHQML
jgi:hypothetical protein